MYVEAQGWVSGVSWIHLHLSFLFEAGSVIQTQRSLDMASFTSQLAQEIACFLLRKLEIGVSCHDYPAMSSEDPKRPSCLRGKHSNY